jgi:hypothetical protein
MSLLMSEQEHRAEKDVPWRRDIRTLGDALGRAIQQHSGTTVFNIEERLRRSCKRLRECVESLSHASEPEAHRLQQEIVALDQEITHIVEKCDLDTAIDVIRAFTVYFHLVNTAEQHHRTRRRFAHEASKPPHCPTWLTRSISRIFPAQQPGHLNHPAASQFPINRASIYCPSHRSHPPQPDHQVPSISNTSGSPRSSIRNDAGLRNTG